MSLDEAIERLEGALADKWCPWNPKLKASIRLGIEALKREKEHRELDIDTRFGLLPGETEE